MPERDFKDRPDDDELGDSDEESSRTEVLPVPVVQPRQRLIPVFALPNVVLFPKVSLPLHIFEERYKTMVSDVLAEDRAIAIALSEEEEGEATPREVCSVGAITQVEELDEGEKNIVVTGLHRARIAEILETRPYIVARVSPLEEPLEGGAAFQAEAEALRSLALQWVFLQDQDGTQELIQRLSLVTDPGHLADFLAAQLFEDAPLKQEILETIEVSRRVSRVHALVAAALQQQQAEKKR
jgi:ATP-dependent Lon protease